MSSKNDHWKSLLEFVGLSTPTNPDENSGKSSAESDAPANSAAGESHAEQTAAPTKATHEAAKPAAPAATKPAGPPKKKGHWSQLAGALGLETAPEPEIEEPAPAPVVVQAPAVREVPRGRSESAPPSFGTGLLDNTAEVPAAREHRAPREEAPRGRDRAPEGRESSDRGFGAPRRNERESEGRGNEARSRRDGGREPSRDLEPIAPEAKAPFAPAPVNDPWSRLLDNDNVRDSRGNDDLSFEHLSTGPADTSGNASSEQRPDRDRTRPPQSRDAGHAPRGDRGPDRSDRGPDRGPSRDRDRSVDSGRGRSDRPRSNERVPESRERSNEFVSSEPSRERAPRAIDPRDIDPRGPEPRSAAPRDPRPRDRDVRDRDPRDRDPRDRDREPRAVEPRAVDPRDVDPRDIDPRDIDPRSATERGGARRRRGGRGRGRSSEERTSLDGAAPVREVTRDSGRESSVRETREPRPPRDVRPAAESRHHSDSRSLPVPADDVDDSFEGDVVSPIVGEDHPLREEGRDSEEAPARRRRRGRRGGRRNREERTTGDAPPSARESREPAADRGPSDRLTSDRRPRESEDSYTSNRGRTRSEESRVEDPDQDDLSLDVLDEDQDANGKYRSHAKIPTWHDAIDDLIESNMANRSSRPEHGGRGGPRRGGSSGGRGGR